MELAYKGVFEMRYYKTPSGAIRKAVDTASGMVDMDTGEAIERGCAVLWTSKDASQEWDVSEQYARMIMPRVHGAERHISGPNAIWLIPANSPNPTGGRPGRKPKGYTVE